MAKIGQWYIIRFVDGVSVNTPANSEEEARAKAPKYHKGEIKSITLIGGKSKPPFKKEERYTSEEIKNDERYLI